MKILHALEKALLLVAACAALGATHPAAAETTAPDTWSVLKKDTFGSREILDGAGKLTLDAPSRAEDAALVPIAIRMAGDVANDVKALTLIVDENPAPVVATFSYGPAAGQGERSISTRVRVNSYSNVRAIAETIDGKLYMVSRFVKAAGGCSAPAGKDADAALAYLGKMQLKLLGSSSGNSPSSEAQLMIRHPNNSGFQMDQLTGLYIPAKFVQFIEVRQGADVVFTMEGGISISEDPNIRFTYMDAPGATLEVIIKDTDGKTFTTRSISQPPNAAGRS